jgi:hypothetical protein
MLRDLFLLIAHSLIFMLGALSVISAVLSAVRNIILPRSAPDIFSRSVFLIVRQFFNLREKRLRTYEERDRAMELYAPLSLLALLSTWLLCILLGYMVMFWAVLHASLYQALKMSGSSLFTLGITSADTFPAILLTFTESMIGLLMIALLISYLPTIYTSFARRETAVTLLETHAGSPPSAIEMIERYYRIEGLEQLGKLWKTWETWFVDVEESHTSLSALPFFRSPRPQRSWVTAAGTILDAASLMNAAIDSPHDPQADLCIRAGYLSLRYIALSLKISFDQNPEPTAPISVTRSEFDCAYDELASAGVPMKPDREQAWRDFSGWRVNYDSVLLALAELTVAPRALWISDRFLMNPPRPLARYRK